MLLKLLWIVVIAWIVHRVFLAARNLYLIATGRDAIPPPEPVRDPARNERGASPPSMSNADARADLSDVEDARWVDL